MDFKSVVESISTITDLKRVSSAYVIDYRNLSNDEVKEALIKTGPQYYFEENLKRTLNELFISPSRDEHVLAPIIVRHMLLHTDDAMILPSDLATAIIEYEQNINNISGDYMDSNKRSQNQNLDLLKFILEVAWENDDSISYDEKNLIEKIRLKLNITDEEFYIVESVLGKFPTDNNNLHTRDQIETVKRKLQSSGILFSVRDEDKETYDVIPEEIVNSLRKITGIEMKHHGYYELLDNNFVKNKAYLSYILEKGNVEFSKSAKVTELQELCLTYIKPTTLLSGYSGRDGLDSTTLSKWCGKLHLQVSGQKNELINRIITYYDNIRAEFIDLEDERLLWFEHYEDLASRNLETLRAKNIINKDIECERKFEQATYYIFEELLMHKPLSLKGTEHADGILSYQDKVILWDNKSKETTVNLIDHIKQFDRYIKKSEKNIPIFIVIAPSFTDNSTGVAMQYMLNSDTTFLLITAKELKELAINWDKNFKDGKKPFPLGYFKQPGRFNSNLISY